MISENQLKQIFKVAGVVLVGYAAFKLFKGNSVKKTIKDVIEIPAKIADETIDASKKIVKSVGRLIKGSPEAKERMKYLSSIPRKKGLKRNRKSKGHKTKKGLALDQKKKSKEKHEKAYRKSKDKKLK